LKSELPSPVIKGKKFEIEIELVDRNDLLIENGNKLAVDMQLLSSDAVPEPIESYSGQQILRYSLDAKLQKGRCRIGKVQINEVSSRFRNGWVQLQISLSRQNVHYTQDDIKAEDVKGMMIRHIVVKSKEL
jgi:hypothetical protein